MMTSSILIVDDDDNVRELVVRFLRPKGYETVDVASAEEALPFLDRKDMDAVITDLKMPGMDGLELARRSLKTDPDRPVILMTAYADMDNARQSISIGIYEFLVKPFDIKDFGDTIRRALERRRLVLENRAYQRNLEQLVEERTRELQEALNQLRRKVKELEGHDRINRLLLRVHTPEETLRTVLEAVQGALDLDRVVIFLADDMGKKVEPVIGWEAQSPEGRVSAEGLRRELLPWLEAAETLALRAFREERALEGEGASAQGGMAVPMTRLGEGVGAIFAQNPLSDRCLSEEERRVLEGLAAQAAVAISDARLYVDDEIWKSMMESLDELPREV